MFGFKKVIDETISREEFWETLSTDHGIKAGDIVQTRDISRGSKLVSGGWSYDCAVVMSVNPFIMVSEETDMKWSCAKAEDFEPVGVRASQRWFKHCWKKRMDGKPPKYRR